MKFYKLTEITEEEYLDKTDDRWDYSICVQSVMKEDDGVYIAINDYETDRIEICLEDLEDNSEAMKEVVEECESDNDDDYYAELIAHEMEETEDEEM